MSKWQVDDLIEENKALRSEIKEIYKTVLQNYGDDPKTFSHKDIIRVLNNICEEASLWDDLDSETKEELKWVVKMKLKN